MIIRRILFELRTAAMRTKSVPLRFAAIASALLILIVFVSLIIYLPYDVLVNGPKAAETLKNLENEFKTIAPPKNASQLRCGSMHKTHQGDVSCEYKTD